MFLWQCTYGLNYMIKNIDKNVSNTFSTILKLSNGMLEISLLPMFAPA